MSFTVYVGSTTKRLNSTLQPSVSGWTSTEAVWKNAKDLDRPTISLYLPGMSEYPQWNYMYIPVVNSYYWVTAIVTPRADTWEVSGEMDVLATYRSAIIGTSCLIEYGFNEEVENHNGRITDNRQAISLVPSISKAQVDITDGAISVNSGIFILSAVGRNNGVNTYYLSQAQMRSLLNNINSDIISDIAEGATIEEILRYFTIHGLSQGSAVSAIKNCFFLPVNASVVSGTSTSVYLGDYDTGVTGIALENTTWTATTHLDIPWPVDDWRRNNCQIILYVPFCGIVGIPVDKLNDSEQIDIIFSLDLLSGNIAVLIMGNTGSGNGYPVYSGSSNIAAPYAVGSSNVPIQNVIGGVSSIIGGSISAGAGIAATVAGLGVGGAALGPVGAAAGSVLGAGFGLAGIGSGISSMVGGLMQAVTPVVQCAGTIAGLASIGLPVIAELTLLYYEPIDYTNFRNLYGHPVMRISTPVAGYCKTRGFSLTGATAREAEQRLIAYFMDSGTFIE